MSKIGVFIICWTGKEENARHIAAALVDFVDQLVVVYSTRDGSKQAGAGDWIQVPDKWYFGQKFKRTLELNDSDYMVHIHADAYSDNWIQVIQAFKDTYYSNLDLGIWSPEIDFTPWKTDSVEILRTGGGRYSIVAQTDCIVWGISRLVVNRLAGLYYGNNNLGWGIDWAAIAFCYSHNLFVCRDHSVKIYHPKGTGYSSDEAEIQMIVFLDQLVTGEKVMFQLLKLFVDQKKFISSLRVA